MAVDWNQAFLDADHRWRMGLRPGDAAEFFTPADSTGEVLNQRRRWLTEEPALHSALTPEAEPALRETVALARGLGKTVDERASPQDQLIELGCCWEPDFIWMHPDGTGSHRLTGGVVCFPSFWAMTEKVGLRMPEIHAPVPGLNDQLAAQIDRFLSLQQPGVAWLRENTGYCRDAELNHHPLKPFRPLDETTTPEEFRIRTEHQLLLKLPESGSILFGIHVQVWRLTDLIAEPSLAARIARVLSTMAPDAAGYKGVAAARLKIAEAIQERSGAG